MTFSNGAPAEVHRKINAFVVQQQAWDAPLFFLGTTWVTTKGIRHLGDGSSTLRTIRAFGPA